MKKLYLLALVLMAYNLSFAQDTNEIEVKTDVNNVTVFIEGAQITRKKTVELKPGTSILKFVNLSPFITPKSVRVKADNNITVLSVNHQQNYLDKLEKSKEIIDLENKLEDIQSKIQIENTHLEITKEEIAFLKDNRTIGGKNQTVSATDLKTTSDFYSTKLTSLKLSELERQKTLKKLFEEKEAVSNQIKTITGKQDYANGEVIVKVKTENYTKAPIELTYMVNNAGWFPSYDIRAKNVNEPIEIVYKANVKQDTKIDWKNVKLKFSSANPNLSGSMQELKTYYLDYYTSPPRYDASVNEVSGTVLDSENLPLPGVSIVVKGTTIGTSTNFDGYYSITVPNSSSVLEYSYIGYETKSLPADRSVINVRLEESAERLEEVVVMGYSAKREYDVSSKLAGKVAGVQIEGDTYSNSIPLEKVENQTTVDFEIDIPYSVKSDNKSYAVDMVSYRVPADYLYYSAPKIEKEAFLKASITKWEQYNLLEGEANIFFENTFIGKTLLDVRYTSDTLKLSLGRDKSVVVNREKVTDFSSKKFIGTKKEEIREWKITIKNTKSQKIGMRVLDQVPVSRLDEIIVDVIELSKGKQNTETGEVTWDFELAPNETKTLILKYAVKFPKNRNLVVE